MFKKMLLLLTIFSLFAGCAKQPGAAGNGQKQAPTNGPTPASDVNSFDDLQKQLRASGAAVEQAEPVEQPFFSVPGQKLLVNGQELQVFEYADEGARQAESSQISKDGSSIGTSMVSWMEPPHFWAQGKMIALYVGKNQEMIDLTSSVLGAVIAQP